MSRGSGKISRVSDSECEKEAADNLTPWMERLVQQLMKSQETAVERSRSRNSIVHDVHNIMTTKHRYATVEDAVEDMRHRSGLNSYLNKLNSDKSARKTASAKSIVAQIMEHYEVETVPEALAKYDINDQLINFIKNTIETGHGVSVAIPQLQHDILHVFGPRYKIQPEDVHNNEVAEFINKYIQDAQDFVTEEAGDPNIGKGVGIRDDESSEDQDYFKGLTPE